MFEQDPPPEADPISITVDQKVWNVTAAKKMLVTVDESIITKKVICFTPPKAAGARQCCVDKSMAALDEDNIEPADEAATKSYAKARLECF